MISASNVEARTCDVRNWSETTAFVPYLWFNDAEVTRGVKYGWKNELVRMCPGFTLFINGLFNDISNRGERIFPLASVSRPALGSTQPPVQWVPGVLSRGGKARPGRDVDHSPHLVPRSRMSRSYTSPPSVFMACSETALYLFNDALSSWDSRIEYIMIDWIMAYKECEGMGSGLI
jgi:hypothetical protein